MRPYLMQSRQHIWITDEHGTSTENTTVKTEMRSGGVPERKQRGTDLQWLRFVQTLSEGGHANRSTLVNHRYLPGVPAPLALQSMSQRLRTRVLSKTRAKHASKKRPTNSTAVLTKLDKPLRIMSTTAYNVRIPMNNTRTDLLDKLTREIEVETLVRLYEAAHGKKISFETLAEPFGISKQTLHNHYKKRSEPRM